jgi:Rrf2 family protein
VTERVDYALKSVLLLAQHTGDFLTTKAMAAHYGMSPKMLASVLWNLRSAEILESRPGWHGGFRLARLPQAIPVSVVIAAANNVDELVPRPNGRTQISPNSPTGESGERPVDLVDSFWQALDDHVQGTLTAFSVADLALARSLS